VRLLSDLIQNLSYDALTGRKLWSQIYNGSECTDAAAAVAVSPGNNDNNAAFVTGSSGRLSREDYATVAYDATTGAELWAKRYDGPTHDPDEAFALALSPDGTKVFVTGRSFGDIGEGRDFATVAYSTIKQNPPSWILADDDGFPCICYAKLLCSPPCLSLPRAKRP
jgi:outer membrane protein assembly factor BamB